MGTTRYELIEQSESQAPSRQKITAGDETIRSGSDWTALLIEYRCRNKRAACSGMSWRLAHYGVVLLPARLSAIASRNAAQPAANARQERATTD